MHILRKTNYSTTVETEVETECPVEVFAFDNVLIKCEFHTMVTNHTLVTSLEDITRRWRYTHMHDLVVHHCVVISNIKASLIVKELDIHTNFP